MKKIVFIIDQVYLHGGIERVLSIKANYFAKKPENSVYIITTKQKGRKPCYDFSNKIQFTDLQVEYQNEKPYFHPINLLKLPNHISKLKRCLRQVNPDIVVVCSHSTDTYFVPFLLKKIPKVKEFHYSKFIEKSKRANAGFLKKYFFKFADYVESKYDKLVVLNKDEALYYKSNNSIIIPNPLTFYPDEVSKLDKKIVVAAGRIAPVKGYNFLIEIWKKVIKENKDWQLHIYGSGEASYEDELKEQIKYNHLSDFVFLKGATSQIKEKMIESSIFAMTSHNECFPLVLLEAQACGLPIVSFNCPYGPQNIIDISNGVIVEHYNQEAFAETLVKLFNDPVSLKKMGTKARENSKKYAVAKVMGQWDKMFETEIELKKNRV